jgi:peptide/nickel transport system permease protein
LISYVGKRLLSVVPVLAVVAVTVFLIIHITPGDPASIMLGPDATPAQVAQLRHTMGLDRPLWTQFFDWIGGVVRGDLGYSVFLHQNVSTAIGSHLQPTLYLAIFAELLAVAIAVPVGVFAARRRGTAVDQSFMGFALLGVSIPSFLLGLFLVLIFAVGLRWLPSGGYRDPHTGFGLFLQFLILPAIALAAMQAALIARMSRSSMLDVLATNYVKTAKAKGVGERLLVYKHALKNASIPILTVVGQSFGALMTGAVVIETVFNIPGMGQLVINSIQRRDFVVIQGVVLTIALMYVLINLVVDLLYGVLDPRIRKERV